MSPLYLLMAVFVTGASAHCNLHDFGACFDPWTRKLQFPDQPSAAEYKARILQIIRQEGGSGIDRICDALVWLRNCMQPAQYYGCLQLQFLWDLGVGHDETIAFMRDWKIVERGCDHKAVVKTNARCYAQVYNDVNFEQKCGTGNFFHCNTVNQYMACTSKFFTQSCGAEAGHVLCDMEKAGFNESTLNACSDTIACPMQLE